MFDGSRRLLVIERGRPPAQGSWSVPGGRCRSGESAAQACVREVAEETGLDVEVHRWVGRVERDAPEGGVYVIDDFLCGVVGGVLQARDDAADVRWVTRDELAGLTLAAGLLAALTEWDALPD